MTHNQDVHSDSDDEFETHSFSDEYSPTDGFNSRDHPQDFFVDSPTALSKDQEASAQSLTIASSSNRVFQEYRHPSSPPRRHIDDQTPLLYDAPPPAYSGPPSLYQPVSNIADEGTSASSNVILPERTPESMGNPADGFDMEMNQYRRPQRNKANILFSAVGRIVLVFIGFVLLLAILAQVFRGGSKSSDHQLPDTNPSPELPSMPKMPSWCTQGPSKSASFDFENPSLFLFSEEIETHDFNGGIYGRVHLVQAPSSQGSQIKVDVSISSSEPYSITDLHFEQTSDSLILKTPSFNGGDGRYNGGHRPCMTVDVIVYLKEKSDLHNLSVQTKRLEIFLASALKLELDKTTLSTTAGKVQSEAKELESRETRISVGAGSVSGHYNLLDLLSVSTRSGSISIDVTPKKASEDEKPAKLDVKSDAGSINVQMPPRDDQSAIPKRDYQTNIRSSVGSISGTYIHGTNTEVETKSGSLTVDLLPYAADEYPSTLKSSSLSGTSRVNLLPPYKGSTIKRMTSSHSTQTGSLTLTYPQEWVGNISGATKTGSLTLKGKDVVVTEYDDGWVNKKITGRKGTGHLAGKLDFHTTTGSVDATIGETLQGFLRRECESLADAVAGAA